LLQTKHDGKPVIYFDNACQTLRPWPVINAVTDYYQNYSACGGRSMHRLGEKVTQECEEARMAVARLINAKRKEEIIFTRNTTEGINLVAKSSGLKQGDAVLTTDKEHNSNLIPWQLAASKSGIIHKIVPSNEDNTFNLEKMKEMMEDLQDTIKLVSVVDTSNLDGVTNPVQKITELAHRYGAKVLLDAAQAVPHRKINVSGLDVDFLAFSGHKMLGPSGTGVLYGKYHLLEELEPFMAGGETVEYSTYEGHKLLPPPEKFEAGLQDYAGIIGLGEAVRYLKKIGFTDIAEQDYRLNKFITDELMKIPQIKIIGPTHSALRRGIISFYMEGIESHELALILDETANIMIRSGQHCVHSWFASRGIQGSARVSLYFYNTLEEAQLFIDSLKRICKLV